MQKRCKTPQKGCRTRFFRKIITFLPIFCKFSKRFCFNKVSKEVQNPIEKCFYHTHKHHPFIRKKNITSEGSHAHPIIADENSLKQSLTRPRSADQASFRKFNTPLQRRNILRSESPTSTQISRHPLPITTTAIPNATTKTHNKTTRIAHQSISILHPSSTRKRHSQLRQTYSL